jgi:hypothetical protein
MSLTGRSKTTTDEFNGGLKSEESEVRIVQAGVGPAGVGPGSVRTEGDRGSDGSGHGHGRVDDYGEGEAIGVAKSPFAIRTTRTYDVSGEERVSSDEDREAQMSGRTTAWASAV